jgi:hypothetical protein
LLTKIFKVKNSQVFNIDYVKRHNFAHPLSANSIKLTPENTELLCHYSGIYTPVEGNLYHNNTRQIVMKVVDNLIPNGIMREIYIRDEFRGTKSDLIKIIEEGN